MSERVPEGWKRLDLEDGVSALISGQSPNRKENRASGDAFGILKTTAIDWGRFDEQQNQEVLDDFEPNKKHLVLENDILITKAGPAHRVGVVAQARNLTSNVLVSGKMTAVRVNDQFLPDFLTYALCQEDAQNHLKANTTGMAVSQTNFTHDALLRVPILSPSLLEQKKIASILTSVDEVIETTQKQINKLQDLKKATMNELLTKGIGHTEFKDSQLGRIPKSWEVRGLSEVCDIKHGFAFPSEYFTNEPNNYVLLTPGNFHVDGTLYYGSKTKYYAGDIPEDYMLKNGDLLVVMTDLTSQMAILGNALLLKSNKVNLHNQRIGKVVNINSSISSEFLNLIFNSEPIKKNVKDTATGTTVRHTSPTRMLNASFPLPTLVEQNEIVTVLDSIERTTDQKVTKLSHTQSLKKSLMQDLLTGKVRVQVH